MLHQGFVGRHNDAPRVPCACDFGGLVEFEREQELRQRRVRAGKKRGLKQNAEIVIRINPSGSGAP
jgi:hypothetical protein